MTEVWRNWRDSVVKRAQTVVDIVLGDLEGCQTGQAALAVSDPVAIQIQETRN